MSQINFYVLPPTKPLIPFVCQLTQTALKKSPDKLLLVAPATQLVILDEQLWAFSDTAFIPHEIVPDEVSLDSLVTTASVLLTANAAHVAAFAGVVINLTLSPVLNFHGTKLLEIIPDDPASLTAGRQKYRTYQTQYPELLPTTYRL